VGDGWSAPEDRWVTAGAALTVIVEGAEMAAIRLLELVASLG